ncbi:MAG: amino acid ABC transporter ATP-binding protein [SAR202 cluster bacterium]|jgi:polar amino acid transport system ATP-binding protein|uniref:ABC transporter domain-containing protein n=1 Tax=marine metagenome TaxID=408172 RepID=A0A382NRT5_9ZZZZ|nr:amino acid ABC transporter ATP-binding protein [SAR202 cluster bacterium]|tara:strand:+ start:311 stop:1051 length:741 start_codon:yes stop_codon:yes gene_type:complete
MPQLEIRGVCVHYELSVPILKNIDLDIFKGEIVSIIGPSGSGKSTLLRVLIGLLPPAQGTVSFNGKVVDYNSKTCLKELRDQMTIVFQQFNLFQNMSALKNVTIAPIEIKKEPKKIAEERSRFLLDRIGLSEKLNAYPDELSGGQQQRVALARALALNPDILLLDEVTSALDPEMTNEVLDAIRELSEDGITLIIVSHEMAFVREVSDRVIMMADGCIIEDGTPTEIFDMPKTDRCKDFVGMILSH